MTKNILVIDDSALMRRVLSDIINSDERYHVAALAVNGLEALDLLVKDFKSFDAIICDINMPKMNGLEFLEQLNKHKLNCPVIIVSTLAKEGAKETIQALELGAFDFVTKPESFFDTKGDPFKEKIIRALELSTEGRKTTARDILQSLPKKERLNLKQPTFVLSSKSITKPVHKDAKQLIALACSTGGPRALSEVIPKLPKDLNCPMLIVQHMPEGFTNSLALRLNETSNVNVKEAADGDILENGMVYIAKGGSQMRVTRRVDGKHQLQVTVETSRNGLKPCADIMYESLVETGYDEIICVVLTGMGADGTQGIKKLSSNKAIYVISQDEESSVVYGMPKVIAEAGLVNEVQSLEEISGAIMKKVGVQ